MVMDLLRMAQQLEKELPRVNQIMAFLKPKFTLVGSAAEGTRIGLGNEIDLTMRFQGWMQGRDSWLSNTREITVLNVL